MKKFLSFVITSLFAISSFAQLNTLFVQGTVSKEEGTGTVDLMMACTEEVQSIGSYIYFPEGITPVSIESVSPVPVGYNYIPSDEDGVNYLIISYLPQTGDQEMPSSSDPVCVGKITVTIDNSVAIGDHEVVCKKVELSNVRGTITPADGVGILTVQKAAVIEEMPEGFGVTINPFVAEDGDITLNFNYKSAKDIKNLSFDVELPKGIYFIDDEEWDKSNVTSSLSASKTGEPTLSCTLGSGDAPTTAKISVAGTYTSKSKKFINSSTSYSSLANISACVMTGQDIDEFEWDKEVMTEGLATIKLTNIVLEDVDGNTYKGEYLASVIYGQPSAQETILYGNYDEATASAFTTALKNVAIADVTAATVAEGVKFTDVLVNEKGGNSYYTRTSANYGTTVLPLDLTTENVDELYTIESMDANSIVLTEAASVSANTPCIFKGTINVEGATPTLGVPSEQGLGQTTFKGTYEATNIADGAGYYIAADGKFYGDGASVAPFRGYFDGAIAGVKEFRVSLVTPNGLIDITDQFSSEDIYNLQGIRVQNAKKGVNIVGGKKVYVK